MLVELAGSGAQEVKVENQWRHSGEWYRRVNEPSNSKNVLQWRVILGSTELPLKLFAKQANRCERIDVVGRLEAAAHLLVLIEALGSGRHAQEWVGNKGSRRKCSFLQSIYVSFISWTTTTSNSKA